MTHRARPHLSIPSSALIRYGTIDAEHEGLIALINRTCDVAEETRFASAQLGPLYAEMTQKFAEHFASEERTMERAGFPGLAAHQAQHQELRVKMIEICERSRKGYFAEAQDLQGFFDSIVDDMLRADLPFKTYLNHQGMS
jgi:hemerythrin-like metal-binding protein